MIKIKVTYNAKPKETKVIEAGTLEELRAKIYEEFEIENGKLNFMKPRLKVNAFLFRIRRPSRKISRRTWRY